MSNAASTDDVWTVERILTWTTDYLLKQGVESARLEAELLCAHARQCQRIRLYTDFDVPLTDAERKRMREYVRRRAAREPLAYITGVREFYGRNFQVSAGILIPRPETETLVDLSLERLPADGPCRVLEVGFGSGCIAITLAAQRPQCRVIAYDISGVCYEVAQQNAKKYDVADRVDLIQADASEALADMEVAGSFDAFISNPPYVCEGELPDLQPEVSQHEPREALVSGKDGLDLIRRLIPLAMPLLKPRAWIGLECDPAQCETVAELMTVAELSNVSIHQDHREIDRIVTGIK